MLRSKFVFATVFFCYCTLLQAQRANAQTPVSVAINSPIANQPIPSAGIVTVDATALTGNSPGLYHTTV